MAIRGVIFDLGHTLVYLDGTWPQIFEQGARDLKAFLDGQGLDIPGGEFAQTLLDRRAECYAQAKRTMREITAEASMRWTFARFGLPDPDPALVNGAIDASFADEKARWLPCAEAFNVLRELAGRGLRLGMFSNATHDPFVQCLVDRLGFRPWLDPALSSAGTGIRKPDPAAFTPILAAWKLPPESVVMVGDTLEADILGAHRAGMRNIWIRGREDARQEGTGDDQDIPQEPIVPDAEIRCLDELPACLERL
jgi:putative hydrolase of the HAD superfamily